MFHPLQRLSFLMCQLILRLFFCLADRLRTAVNRITQDCEEWLKPKALTSSVSLPTSLNSSLKNMDLTPTIPPGTNFSHSPDLKVSA